MESIKQIPSLSTLRFHKFTNYDKNKKYNHCKLTNSYFCVDTIGYVYIGMMRYQYDSGLQAYLYSDNKDSGCVYLTVLDYRTVD